MECKHEWIFEKLINEYETWIPYPFCILLKPSETYRKFVCHKCAISKLVKYTEEEE